MKTLRPYQQEILSTLKTRLKETTHPLLVNASVGSGKSLIIAELLKSVEAAGWRALCLTMNSTLIRQNAETYAAQGGHPGIFCASLGIKDTKAPVIFASPLSVYGSIKPPGRISVVPFNLIVIDECHNVNVVDKKTTYMQIFTHYQELAQKRKHKLRFVGLTGTPYRGKGHTIVGESQFFKEEVCAVTAEWLIDNHYLTQPIWGYCEKTLQYDFDKLRINAMGKFNSVDLENALNKKPRLTAKIMAEVIEIVKNRKGAFIFASSIKHCHECAEWLPPDETAVITGSTSDKEREHYINQARTGIIKYLVNVNVLCTGVDVPSFDTVVFVRPTESLVLYMQCLGRGLRLADGKTDCLILDYAGNLDRHGDIDNPIINKALQSRNSEDPDYCIECFDCNSMNTLMARRCIGTKEGKRCDHWFEFKECPGCGVKNDIVSRQCRSCHIELIDPNRNLSEIASNKDKIVLQVLQTQYSLTIINGSPRFDICYFASAPHSPIIKKIHERFLLSSNKARDFFYHVIVKLHFMHPWQAYKNLHNEKYLKSIVENNELYSPHTIECILSSNGNLKVVKKHFDHKTGEDDCRQLDVIYTFIETCEIKSTVTFEYLVKENDSFNLIIDKYRINNPASKKRFMKNYGSGVGADVKTIGSNGHLICTPRKIYVDSNNEMKEFVENIPKIPAAHRYNFILSRTGLSLAFEKWAEIIKIKIFSNKIAHDRSGKAFKMFRVEIYAYIKTENAWGNEIECIFNVSCKIAESDLDKINSKEYRYLQVRADGRWAEDVEKWKNIEGQEFEKINCFDWESSRYSEIQLPA